MSSVEKNSLGQPMSIRVEFMDRPATLRPINPEVTMRNLSLANQVEERMARERLVLGVRRVIDGIDGITRK